MEEVPVPEDLADYEIEYSRRRCSPISRRLFHPARRDVHRTAQELDHDYRGHDDHVAFSE
jgi:hypothetical protein